jgi:CTP:molybdopterin cytidylyltransferase MocA
MGSPKALLSYHGRPFLDHLLNATIQPQIGARRVVLGAHAKQIAGAIPLIADEVVINKEWERGQLSSLQAALRSLPAGTDGILLCLVDHPLISAGLVSDLIDRFYSVNKPIVVPSYRGRRGHPVIFSSSLYEELLRSPLETGARAVVWAHADEVEEFLTNEEGCVLNMNDPDALQEALDHTN